MGITTGEAFCGVVGSKTRKEYTVLVSRHSRKHTTLFGVPGNLILIYGDPEVFVRSDSSSHFSSNSLMQGLGPTISLAL